ncbi:MAG: hypothetical protein IT428_04160 [Planctomycetaceae bacterium]|nr:hypothetical protein [Planctomycetaceae bacterium]
MSTPKHSLPVTIAKAGWLGPLTGILLSVIAGSVRVQGAEGRLVEGIIRMLASLCFGIGMLSTIVALFFLGKPRERGFTENLFAAVLVNGAISLIIVVMIVAILR